ncbi:hypothetical protein ES702_02689 [subsurface metagenome]
MAKTYEQLSLEAKMARDGLEHLPAENLFHLTRATRRLAEVVMDLLETLETEAEKKG